MMFGPLSQQDIKLTFAKLSFHLLLHIIYIHETNPIKAGLNCKILFNIYVFIRKRNIN